MSQFSGTKNPPWARPQAVTDFTTVSASSSINNMPQSQVATPLMQQQQVQPIYHGMSSAGQNVVNPQQYTAQQLLGLQAQQQAAAALQQQAQVIPQPGIAIPTTLATTQVATVSYPAPRAAAVPANQPKQRVFTGTITKLHDNFGFVDEDVFFQTSCVKGSAPKVNDRVLVEASFNANMPFKWNATRIQVLPNQVGPQGNHQNINKPVFGVQQGNQMGGFTGQPAPQPLMQQGFNEALIPRNSGNVRRNERFERERERKRDRERRERNERPPPPRKRSRSKSPSSKRSESTSHQRSPARRRPRIVPRYVVQVPKLSFDMKEANVISLKSRYTNLYIPSDFFNASFEWTEAFPCFRPFQMGNHCGFHIMHKDVEPLNTNDSVLDPPDADHLFSAKVMLMSCPSLEDLYHKSCALADDPPEVQEGFVHPTRLIHFLVGLKGKNETMAIGGPWSPSLDGPNPREDPQVLIRTAIRTTKALTGIDLNSCTQWYQFAEVRYLRQEEMHKGKLVPARVETTVIFLPDVWSCNPTRLEWATLQAAYKKQLQKKVASVTKGEGKEANSQEEEETEGEISEENKEPTHYSELDPKTMKIIDLRRELESRSVSSKGLKSQLIARLTKALKSEQEKEEEQEAMEGQQNTEVSEEVKKNLDAADEKSDEKKKEQEEEKKKREERDKASLERKYALPDNPNIIVHPSSVAKGGKFDCSLMSLSVLLDYRPEDNKEHSFEVSLFAELFNEMLMRDYGFEIYKALIKAPEKKEEEKKEKRSADDKSSKDSSSAKKKKTDEKEKQDSNKKDSKESKEKEKKKEDDKKDQEKKEEEEGDDEDGKKDKEEKKKREKKKYQTKDPALLLAFTYFDQNHTGYLLDKDVEEIIHTIGLQLSRAQVKKLVQKLVTRDALNYRKLTDKPVPTPGEKEESSLEEKELNVPDIIKLSKGNSEYLPCQSPVKSESVDMKVEKKSPKAQEVKDAPSHMITYKGAMIDIESLMTQLERSEKTRAEMEKQMMEINKEKDQMKKSIDVKDEKSEKLSTELKNLKQKLLVQEKITNNSESTSKKYLSALMESREHLNAMLSTITNALGEKEAVEDIKKETESNGNS